MDGSAVSADRVSMADTPKDSASRIRPVVENDRMMESDPLRGLVQGAQCRRCGPLLESMGLGMASMPGAQRRQAALSLQRCKGNRFMQGIAAAQVPVQAKMMAEPARGEYKRAVSMPEAHAVQRQADPELEEDEYEDEVLQGKFLPVQRASRTGEGRPPQGMAGGANVPKSEPQPNRTGMPDRLKAGIEGLSGIDMSDVRVHANSDRPARLNALAYTQGNQIYLGAGQDRHLPHEAWHAVQQKQGRVRATGQMGGLEVNDEVGLGGEAERIGDRVFHRDVFAVKGSVGNGLYRQRLQTPFALKKKKMIYRSMAPIQLFKSISLEGGLDDKSYDWRVNEVLEGGRGFNEANLARAEIITNDKKTEQVFAYSQHEISHSEERLIEKIKNKYPEGTLMQDPNNEGQTRIKEIYTEIEPCKKENADAARRKRNDGNCWDYLTKISMLTFL